MASKVVEQALLSQKTAQKRRRTTSQSKKGEKDPKKRKSKASEKLIPHTVEDIEALQQNLALVINYNEIAKVHYAHVGYTLQNQMYYFAPIVLAQPRGKHLLPADGESYIPGPHNPTTVEMLIRETFYSRYPDKDRSVNDHENYSLWRWNRVFYGAKAFKTKISVLAVQQLMHESRSFGGSRVPHTENIAQIITNKTVRPWATSFASYFAEFPDRAGGKTFNFLPLDNLIAISQEMKKKADTAVAFTGDIEKQVRSVPSDDEDDEEDEETDSSDEE